MLKIDKAIYDVETVICKNIDLLAGCDRGLLSQNILSQLRNLVEYTMKKIYSQGADIDPNDDSNRKSACVYVASQGNLRFLRNFHFLLQKSVSHYSQDEGGSERLMLKYYEYLLRLKSFFKTEYGMDILSNLKKFPIDQDTHLYEYYEQIAFKITSTQGKTKKWRYDDRCYIQKIKPFFINETIFYEVTFTVANDSINKFDRVIAFTNQEICDNYAIRLSLRNEEISVSNRSIPIQIIDQWQVSIRPCELNKFSKIFGNESVIKSNYKEYQELMKFLTETRMSLVEFISCPDDYYFYVKNRILENANTVLFFETLDVCRTLLVKKAPGYIVISYLLYKLNNRVLKNQLSLESCKYLSELKLSFGCIPFDQMPFASSLLSHNPRLEDLMACIDPSERECEFLARRVQANSEENGILFTPLEDLGQFADVGQLITEFNSRLYWKHEGRKIRKYHDFVYIEEMAKDSAEVIKKLIELTRKGIGGYRLSIESWLREYEVDCPEKKDALLKMFEESSVGLIYGSAGTGKSTLIKHFSNFFSDREKIFLANTHPAVDNLRRKIKTSKSSFMTIKRFLSKNNTLRKCDVLVIDECSMVSNHDMREILSTADFRLLILVGDTYQIESVRFGNWFDITRNFLPEKAITELTKPYRATNKDLLTIWKRVRDLDIAILEPLVKGGYSQDLSTFNFEHSNDDEIVLCLNYDGLYGINNINRFFQSYNENYPVEWGVSTYKVGDPILFSESRRFSPLIYNNMKGRIAGIGIEEKRIWFEIALDIAVNELDASGYDFKLIGTTQEGNSIIGFWVNKYLNTDEEDASNVVVPFQIAYAVSIHKAQGLEYKSVRIVITNTVEELITHNIFYTAITRAKEQLKIYWTPETEKNILESLKKRNNSRDASLLKVTYSL